VSVDEIMVGMRNLLAFRAELREELAQRHLGFEERLREGGGEEIRRVIRETRASGAHRVLRPFPDAYHVVADTLAHRPPDDAFEAAAFLDQCLRVGRQYLLQRRVLAPGSVSKMPFETGCGSRATAGSSRRARPTSPSARAPSRRRSATRCGASRSSRRSPPPAAPG
jgi:glycerol-3-phosphate O-acyltransferase